MKTIRFSSCFFLMAAVLFSSAYSEEDSPRAIARMETYEYMNREWLNYRLLLQEAGRPSARAITTGDILMQPNVSPDLVLHQDLLESLYEENKINVFFVLEVPPYYPSQRYNRVPWLSPANHWFFGNSFWISDARIRDVYNSAYGNSRTDFNSTMQRVERYNKAEEKPMTVVFATLSRTGASTMWKNAWGWDHYYFFTGWQTYTPRR